MKGLPEGWESCLTGDIAKVVGGGTPDAANSENFSSHDGIPWLTPADLSDFSGIYVSRGKRFLTVKGYESSSAKLMPRGAVLFSSRAPIGYVAVAANEISTNQGFKSFVCEVGILPEYLFFYLKYAKPLAEELASGTTFAEISGKNAALIPVVLPPLNEQRRIVAKLEELLAKVDTSQQRLAKIPVILKRFRQAVLAAACSGRLTADWREEDPTNKIVGAKQGSSASPVIGCDADMGEAGESLASPLQNGGEGEELPEGWVYSGIEPLLSTRRKGLKTGPFGSMLKKHEHQPSGTPVLGIENIGFMQFIAGSKIHITTEKALELKEFDARPGDILISRSGTVGEVCVVPEEITEARISTNIMRVVLNEKRMTPKLFCFLFNGAPFVLNQVAELCKGSTRDFLNQSILKVISFPLPPLPEQHEIVRRVEALLTLADQLEARYHKAKAHVDRLTQSILAKAFRGELVPQDPAAEPASVLLERIRAERAKTAPAPRSKATPRSTQKTYTPEPEPLPLAAERTVPYGATIPQRILSAMKPGRDYSRADVTAASSITDAEWIWAIRQLKEEGKVRQTGERRGARYRRA